MTVFAQSKNFIKTFFDPNRVNLIVFCENQAVNCGRFDVDHHIKIDKVGNVFSIGVVFSGIVSKIQNV